MARQHYCYLSYLLLMVLAYGKATLLLSIILINGACLWQGQHYCYPSYLLMVLAYSKATLLLSVILIINGACLWQGNIIVIRHTY